MLLKDCFKTIQLFLPTLLTQQLVLVFQGIAAIPPPPGCPPALTRVRGPPAEPHCLPVSPRLSTGYAGLHSQSEVSALVSAKTSRSGPVTWVLLQPSSAQQRQALLNKDPCADRTPRTACSTRTGCVTPHPTAGWTRLCPRILRRGSRGQLWPQRPGRGEVEGEVGGSRQGQCFWEFHLGPPAPALPKWGGSGSQSSRERAASGHACGSVWGHLSSQPRGEVLPLAPGGCD